MSKMYVFLSHLVSSAGCGIRLYRFLIIAFSSTLGLFACLCKVGRAFTCCMVLYSGICDKKSFFNCQCLCFIVLVFGEYFISAFESHDMTDTIFFESEISNLHTNLFLIFSNDGASLTHFIKSFCLKFIAFRHRKKKKLL